MSSLNHPNLVRLLGTCTDNNPTTGMKEQILIYEFVAKGDLQSLLEGNGMLLKTGHCMTRYETAENDVARDDVTRHDTT